MKEEKNHKNTEINIQSNPAELEEKAKLVDEYLDQLQRLQADFENYRKRAIKEKDEFRKYVIEGFLYSSLDLIDNLQRAIDASSQNHSYDSLVNGITIVEKQFLDLLKTQNVRPITVNAGEKFDPHVHHAVNHENSDKIPEEAIVKVLQPGYTIGDRILRPAMVVVSSGQKKNEIQDKNNETRK